MTTELTLREWNGIEIPQRPDGYINATKMCQAGGKLFADWQRLKATKEYLVACESVMGIPITGLILTFQGGTPDLQGTWVHPRLASRLAQWISPEFAVVVDGWVLDIISGKHPMPNEISHEGAIAKGIAALMESGARLEAAMSTLTLQQAETGRKVDTVICKVEDLDHRVGRLEQKGRRDPSTRARNILKSVVWRYYNGNCPIYRHIKILESEQVIITTPGNRTVAEIDHWYAAHKNDVSEMWLISKQAHQELTQSTNARDEYFQTFREFQRLVAEYIHETEGHQLRLV